MHNNDLPAKIAEFMWASGFGLLGRVLFLARADRRRFGWSLMWEIPIAIAMGIVGGGIAEWLIFTDRAEQALIVVCSYLGPRALDALLDVALRRIALRGSSKGQDNDSPR